MFSSVRSCLLFLHIRDDNCSDVVSLSGIAGVCVCVGVGVWCVFVCGVVCVGWWVRVCGCVCVWLCGCVGGAVVVWCVCVCVCALAFAGVCVCLFICPFLCMSVCV